MVECPLDLAATRLDFGGRLGDALARVGDGECDVGTRGGPWQRAMFGIELELERLSADLDGRSVPAKLGGRKLKIDAAEESRDVDATRKLSANCVE